MHVYFSTADFPQCTALLGTARLFFGGLKSPLHIYLGMHNFWNPLNDYFVGNARWIGELAFNAILRFQWHFLPSKNDHLN